MTPNAPLMALGLANGAPQEHHSVPEMAINVHNAFELCRQALGVTQQELGAMVGVSRRTAQRWTSNGTPSPSMIDLARAVHPRNPALAREIVAAIGTTLEAAGIAALAPPPPLVFVPASAPAPLLQGVVDAVVCATAEAMDMMPSEVRPGLHAAFARAKEIGLSVHSVEEALRAKLSPAPESPSANNAEKPKPKRGR